MDTMFLSKLFLIVSLANFLHDFHVSSCDTSCTDKPVFTPARLLVEYGGSVSASCSVCPNCTYSVFDVEKVFGKNTKTGNTILWEVEKMTEWNPNTFCHYSDASGYQASTELKITVYKPPDSVSFSFFNHTGPMSENGHYTLQCEVQNVAPIGNLTVTFYRGQTALTQLQSSQTGVKPVSETFNHHITTTKEDNGVQFWCEAELELGPEGPQPPPVLTSNKTTACVHYKPEVPSVQNQITITEGERLELNCSAMGNPPPSYFWSTQQSLSSHWNSSVYIIESVTTEQGGQYTCTVISGSEMIVVTYTVDVKAHIPWYIIILTVTLVVMMLLAGLYICYKKSKKGKYNLMIKDGICLSKRQGHVASSIQKEVSGKV